MTDEIRASDIILTTFFNSEVGYKFFDPNDLDWLNYNYHRHDRHLIDPTKTVIQNHIDAARSLIKQFKIKTSYQATLLPVSIRIIYIHFPVNTELTYLP